MPYVWEHENWPALRRHSEALLPLISKARLAQGKLHAEVAGLGFKLGQEAQAEVLIEEAIQTSAIEGERLNRESVRSSVAKRLGLKVSGLSPAGRAVDGLVEALMDATQNYDKPLNEARL